MKRLIVCLPFFLFCLTTAHSQQLLIDQFHASPDPLISPVDVWYQITSPVPQVGMIFDNSSFRDYEPLNQSFPIAATIFGNYILSPSNSTSPTPAIYTDTLTLFPNKPTLIVKHGLLNPSNFAPNPQGKNTTFRHSVIRNIPDAQFAFPQGNSFGFFNAVTDAPALGIALAGNYLVDSVPYGVYYPPLFGLNFTGNFPIDLIDKTNGNVIKKFILPTSSFPGKTVLIVATGFLNPSANQNGSSLALHVIIPNDTSFQIPLNESFIWNGNGNWINNVSNWSTSALPSTVDSVIIQSGTCTLNSSQPINQLVIQNGANLMVGNGATLTVNGSYYNYGGNINCTNGGQVIFKKEGYGINNQKRFTLNSNSVQVGGGIKLN